MSDIKISILTPSDEPAWQDYVNSHPDATIYHTLEWRDILYNEYGFEPLYLIAKEEERVVGILPLFLIKNLRGRRLVSLPFSIYGGPVGDSKEVVSALLKKCVEMVKEGRAASLEIKPCKHLDVEVPGLSFDDWGIGMAVDLTPGMDVLWKRLTDRNDVSRAVREGLKFKPSEGEGIDKFYRLQLATRKRLGLPAPSLRYYNSFFKEMGGCVKLAMIEREGIPVAGGIFFVYKDKILYALGASDHRYLHLRPNDLLIWEMMKWSASAGYKEFDLGPTPSGNDGLLHFKKKWGGKENLVKRCFYPSIQKNIVNPEGNILFKMLPLSVSKLVGSKVIRSMG